MPVSPVEVAGLALLEYHLLMGQSSSRSAQLNKSHWFFSYRYRPNIQNILLYSFNDWRMTWKLVKICKTRFVEPPQYLYLIYDLDDLCSSYLQCTKQVVILHTSNFDVLFNEFAITSACTAAIGANFHSQNIRIGRSVAGAGGFRLWTALRQQRRRLSTPYHLLFRIRSVRCPSACIGAAQR